MPPSVNRRAEERAPLSCTAASPCRRHRAALREDPCSAELVSLRGRAPDLYQRAEAQRLRMVADQSAPRSLSLDDVLAMALEEWLVQRDGLATISSDTHAALVRVSLITGRSVGQLANEAFRKMWP